MGSGFRGLGGLVSVTDPCGSCHAFLLGSCEKASLRPLVPVTPFTGL